MNKHTPGPWYVGPDNRIWRRSPSDLYQYGGGVSGDSPIAAAFDGPTSWVNKFPSEANARLIVAAPELLEALQGLMSRAMLGALSDDDLRSDWGALGMSHIIAARSAIRKATGE